jgi:hypothetical protein
VKRKRNERADGAPSLTLRDLASGALCAIIDACSRVPRLRGAL